MARVSSLDVGVELVGIPAQQQVAGIGVDRTEHLVGGGQLDFVLEGVAGQGGVVGLDVELEVPVQLVGLEEGDAAGHVEVVLMLGRLLRLGLDQELAGEPDRLGVVDRHVQEGRQVIELPLQVGVEQGLIAFAAAPENVILAAEFLGHLDRLLHLGRRVGEDLGIGIGGGAAHIAGIGKQVGRTPEQLDSGRLLQALGVGDHLVEVAVGLAQAPALGGDIPIVETPEGRPDLDEELEGGIHATQGVSQGILAGFPGAVDGRTAERIQARAAERVPIGDTEAHMLRHGLPVDDLVRVIVAKSHQIVGGGSFVGDRLFDLREPGFGGGFLFHRLMGNRNGTPLLGSEA